MDARAAVYCRVSTLVQAAKGYSLDEQRKRLPEMARAAGYTVDDVDIYEEVESGASDDRPAYNRLMARVLEGHYQAVWVVESSRLTRTESREEEHRIVTSLKAFGCVIRTPSGTFDVSTIEGEFTFDIHSAVNRMERKRIRQRMQIGKRAKMRKGEFGGYPPPTGYMKKWAEDGSGVYWVLDGIAVAPVKLAYALALKGFGGTKILQTLTHQGFRTKNGTALSFAHVYQWLRNPHYAGYAHLGYRRGTKVAEKHLAPASYIDQAIVTLEEWETVQELLNGRKHLAPHRKYPLTGLILCPSCKRPLIGTYKGRAKEKKALYYACIPSPTEPPCPGGHGRSIPMDIAHDLLLALLPKIAKYVKKNAQKIQGKLAAQLVPAQEQEQKKQTLKARYADLERRIFANLKEQEISPSAFRRVRLQELEEEIKTVQQELATLEKQPLRVLPGQLIWDEEADLSSLARPFLAEICFARDGTHRRHTYRLTGFKATWGLDYWIDSLGRIQPVT